jgi:Holliday junction resolvase
MIKIERPTTWTSGIHEREIAAYVTKGSGNQAEKGDVRLKGKLRIECKSTDAKSFTVTREMLDKIADAACLAGERPVLAVRFANNFGQTLREVFVVEKWVLDELVGV